MATAVRLAALALAGSAPAADVGANDDTGKYAADAGALSARWARSGLKQSVMTTRFMPSDPTTIQDGREPSTVRFPFSRSSQAFESRSPCYPAAAEIEDGTATPAAFATWLTLVAHPATRPCTSTSS